MSVIHLSPTGVKTFVFRGLIFGLILGGKRHADTGQQSSSTVAVTRQC